GSLPGLTGADATWLRFGTPESTVYLNPAGAGVGVASMPLTRSKARWLPVVRIGRSRAGRNDSPYAPTRYSWWTIGPRAGNEVPAGNSRPARANEASVPQTAPS